MNAIMHPWIREARIVALREGRLGLVKRSAVPGLLLLVCVALAGDGLFVAAWWSLPAATLLALCGSYAICYDRLKKLLREWRTGWLGALPVARRAAVWTLPGLAAAGFALAAVAVSVLLCLLATHSLDVVERYATRAGLLLEGRLRRTWDTGELAALRDDPTRSLEQAMAEACDA